MSEGATPSQDTLHSIFEIKPGGSWLYWLINANTRVRAGDMAGTSTSEGWIVQYQGKQYKIHRIIWKMLHNTEPSIVDHIDIDPLNNDPGNLRAADYSQSQMNRRLQSNNTSGTKGVGRSGSKWHATIKVGGIRTGLGTFDTLEEAVAVRKAAEFEYHGEFSR